MGELASICDDLKEYAKGEDLDFPLFPRLLDYCITRPNINGTLMKRHIKTSTCVYVTVV